MRRIDAFQNEAGLIDLPGSFDPASRSGPPASEPLLLGDVVSVILSDLAVRRSSAPAEFRMEKEGRFLRFAAPRSISRR